MGEVKGRRSVVRAFRLACESADVAGLAAILEPMATALTDGSGPVAAGTQSVEGAEDVIGLVLTSVALRDMVMSEHDVNGQTGLVMRRDSHVVGIICLDVRGARVSHVWMVLGSERLGSWNRG